MVSLFNFLLGCASCFLAVRRTHSDISQALFEQWCSDFDLIDGKLRSIIGLLYTSMSAHLLLVGCSAHSVSP